MSSLQAQITLKLSPPFGGVVEVRRLVSTLYLKRDSCRDTLSQDAAELVGSVANKLWKPDT